MRFAFIQAEKANYPVRLMCRVLKVSRGGFYEWLKRPESERARRDRQLVADIRAVHEESKRRYGSPRVHRELRERGVEVGRRRVERLMRQEGLRARRRRRFVTTTQSNHAHPIAPNHLARQFDVTAPNRVWAADITYVPTRQGWLYLAVVLDLFSRRVVGWATSSRPDTALTARALKMALAQRSVAQGLVHHSDRGCQYASAEYRAILAANDMVCSMSRKGNCYDNAVVESFFSTLEFELFDGQVFASRDQARGALFEFIESFYNQRRRHSTLNYVSPANFERDWKPLPLAA